MISQPIAMTLLSPVAGKLSDKRNPGVIASVGMGMTAVGLILLCFIRETTPNYLIVLLLLIDGNWIWSVFLPKFKCNYEFC